jgi:hypothetical protein
MLIKLNKTIILLLPKKIPDKITFINNIIILSAVGNMGKYFATLVIFPNSSEGGKYVIREENIFAKYLTMLALLLLYCMSLFLSKVK